MNSINSSTPARGNRSAPYQGPVTSNTNTKRNAQAPARNTEHTSHPRPSFYSLSLAASKERKARATASDVPNTPKVTPRAAPKVAPISKALDDGFYSLSREASLSKKRKVKAPTPDVPNTPKVTPRVAPEVVPIFKELDDGQDYSQRLKTPSPSLEDDETRSAVAPDNALEIIDTASPSPMWMEIENSQNKEALPSSINKKSSRVLAYDSQNKKNIPPSPTNFA